MVTGGRLALVLAALVAGSTLAVGSLAPRSSDPRPATPRAVDAERPASAPDAASPEGALTPVPLDGRVYADLSRPLAALATDPAVLAHGAELAAGLDPDAPGAEHPQRKGEPEEEGAELGIPFPRQVVPVTRATDPTLQTAVVAAAAAPTISSTDGIGDRFVGNGITFNVGLAPPDPDIDVGDRQYVQTVNIGFAVFDKATGAVQLGPVPTSTLFAGMSGPCSSANDGDPTIRWDGLAQRWVFLAYALGSTPDYLCFAVSKTEDATGAWYRYGFPQDYYPDYPRLSVWDDAYYVTMNLYTRRFQGIRVCAYPRIAMVGGVPDLSAGTQHCFDGGTGFYSVLASDLDGATPPPAGTPNVIIGFGSANSTTSFLATWRYRYTWAAPQPSATGPNQLGIQAYARPCGGTGATCIPQKGTSLQLQSLGDRLAARFAYRPGASDGTAVVAQTVGSDSVSAIRWYQFRIDATGAVSVLQQGTFSPNDGLHRWVPSAAQDAAGNIAVGYSVSGTNLYPSIRIAGRLAGGGAAAGTLDVPETEITAGSGSQTGSSSRWGDYTDMVVDPDGCTFWYTNQYNAVSAAYRWRTRIARFVLSGCSPANGSYARDTSGLTLTVSPAAVGPRGSVTATARLRTPGGGSTPVGDRLVVLTMFGKTFSVRSNSSGDAAVTATAPRTLGSYPVTATFAGDWTYLPSSAAGTVTVQ